MQPAPTCTPGSLMQGKCPQCGAMNQVSVPGPLNPSCAAASQMAAQQQQFPPQNVAPGPATYQVNSTSFPSGAGPAFPNGAAGNPQLTPVAINRPVPRLTGKQRAVIN